MPLFNPLRLPSGSAAGSTSAPTTTSASFVVIPEMTATIITLTRGGKLLVTFGCTFNVVALDQFDVELYVDGVAIAGTLRNITALTLALTEQVPMSIQGLTDALTPGSHTVEAKWKRSAGTARARGIERGISVVEVPG